MLPLMVSLSNHQIESIDMPGRQSLSPFILANAAWLMLRVAAGPMVAGFAV